MTLEDFLTDVKSDPYWFDGAISDSRLRSIFYNMAPEVRAKFDSIYAQGAKPLRDFLNGH